MGRRSLEQARLELAGSLRERRGEIEEALLTRTYSIADPAEAADPEYEQGLRAAVAAALDYGLAAIEHGEERGPRVPILLLAQARLAARNGVPLDTVLRRYFAGYTLLGDFIVQEGGAASLREPWLKRLLREQAAMFDRFLETVGEEYGQEGKSFPISTEERRAERVRRLLAGELVDASDLGYEIAGHHIGMAAVGLGARELVHDLAGEFDRHLLMVRHDEECVWAWLGGRQPLNSAELLVSAREACPAHLVLALGESGEGIAGWRFTHQQAKVSLRMTSQDEKPVVRYADVGLLASILNDDLLVAFLRERYLEPLVAPPDRGKALRATLRAYLAAGRNITSAAAALGVSRQTVGTRLRVVEKKLDRRLEDCTVEIEAALRLDALEQPTGA